ncbi:MAG TPA: MFS transporter [Firmicutes bacterium]|nr:MFS transporter [Bacillota bacterium]
MNSSISVAIPSISNEFAADTVTLNWVATSYVLASVMFLIPFGKLADIYGRMRLFTYGFIIYLLTAILAPFSTSASLLIASRFIQGIGGAMIFSTGVAIITSVTPAAERGRALGINSAIVYFGAASGPFFGGVLTQHFGWRSIFYANIPFCLLILFLAFWKLKERSKLGEEKINFGSSVIFSLCFLVIMYGFSLIPTVNGILLITAGIIGFTYFFWREGRVKNPVVDIGLFRNNKAFAFSNMAVLISFMATYAVAFLLSLYLQYIKGLSPQTAGTVLMTQTIVQSVISPVAGVLADKFDAKRLASLGMGFKALALSLFAFLGSKTPVGYVFAALIILGLGIGLFSTPNTYVIMSSVDKQYYGVSSATIATMRQSGNLLSMAVIMFIFALTIGRVEITPQHYDAFMLGLKSAFVVYGTLCCLGVFASLAGRSKATDAKVLERETGA